jgi:hypothetical protein
MAFTCSTARQGLLPVACETPLQRSGPSAECCRAVLVLQPTASAPCDIRGKILGPADTNPQQQLLRRFGI